MVPLEGRSGGRGVTGPPVLPQQEKEARDGPAIALRPLPGYGGLNFRRSSQPRWGTSGRAGLAGPLHHACKTKPTESLVNCVVWRLFLPLAGVSIASND